MKKLGKFKLFSLLIFLSVALVFVGINSLEAEKPNNPGKGQPKWEWQVGIPDESLAGDLSCNVYGNSPDTSGGYAVFEKNDFVQMDVKRCEDSETGEIFYHVYLRVYNNNVGYSIGLQKLDFCGCKTRCGDDSLCCVFPTAVRPTGVLCNSLVCPEKVCGGGTGYQCMQDFMENDHPAFGYEVVAIRMYIYCDIEAIPPGGLVPTDGRMWQFDIWNTSAPLFDGNEEYHNIICRYSLLLEDVIIQRSFGEGNTWTIFVNQDGSDSSLYENNRKLLAFWEFYEKAVKEQKGKSGKYHINSEDCYALGGRTVFKFKSIWTRF